MGDVLTLKSPPYEVRPVGELTAAEREQMFGLMGEHFLCERDGFEQDLAEKEWVLLLLQDGKVGGFSTLKRLPLGPDTTAFFSGDTVVSESLRGRANLARIWAQQVFSIAEGDPGHTYYWFLICSGFRTYRFLPVFFKEYYPTLERPTPPQPQAILDRLGHSRYGGRYDQGVVRPVHLTPLRRNDERPKNPHAAFFVQQNPRHLEGYELACLTQVRRSNLTKAGLRML